MEQQSRSNTNVTHQIATHLTSSIKPAHALGLLALNPAPPSTCPSPFSTPSVADSLEFTETNPAAVIDKEASASEQEAPDTVMNDTESESDKEETAAGAALSVPLKEVILKQVIFFDTYTFLYVAKMQLFDILYQP
jgi:hypothetical protein